MSDSQQLPPHMFILEGTFRGCIGQKPHKATSIVLEVEQEQLAIKLPKELQATLPEYQLRPGHQIRCIGRSQVDLKAGVVKLKAYQLFRLFPPTETHHPTVITPTVTVSPRKLAPLPRHKPAKILICRKSGCKKRGGQTLVSTLEKILKEHNLHNQVEIQYTGCQKRCKKAPTLTIMPGNYRYDKLSLASIRTVIAEHFDM